MIYYKKTIKRISLFLCIPLLCLFTGCNYRKTDEANNNQISLTPTPIITDQNLESVKTPEENDKTQETDIDNNEATTKLTEDPKLEDFSKMDEFIKDYEFDVSYDENIVFYQRTYSIYGEYDLNGDGEIDIINALLKPHRYEDGSYIEVNDIKVPLFLDYPTGEIYIIDLDSRDNYCEIAIFDWGPSDDPVFDFFRFDGKEFYFLHSMDRAALMDGQGKFISWFHLADNFTPQFYSAWGEYKNGEYVLNNHDVSQYIGKTYKLDGMAYFIPMDKNPDNYYDYMIWDSEVLKEFKTTEIKLLDIHIEEYDRTLYRFYVEMPDGERGLLYFWIGD